MVLVTWFETSPSLGFPMGSGYPCIGLHRKLQPSILALWRNHHTFCLAISTARCLGYPIRHAKKASHGRGVLYPDIQLNGVASFSYCSWQQPSGNGLWLRCMHHSISPSPCPSEGKNKSVDCTISVICYNGYHQREKEVIWYFPTRDPFSKRYAP